MERLHLFLTPKPHTPTHIPITNYTNQTTIGLKNYFTHVEFSQSISFFFFWLFLFSKKIRIYSFGQNRSGEWGPNFRNQSIFSFTFFFIKTICRYTENIFISNKSCIQLLWVNKNIIHTRDRLINIKLSCLRKQFTFNCLIFRHHWYVYQLLVHVNYMIARIIIYILLNCGYINFRGFNKHRSFTDTLIRRQWSCQYNVLLETTLQWIFNFVD